MIILRIRTVRLLAVLLFALAPFILVGCGGGPTTATVTGRITVSGKSAARGSVMFMPDERKGTSGKVAVGDIGPDGTYTLRTFGPGDGAIVGHHRVVVSGRALEDDENVPPDKRIPPRYSNPKRSGLTAEVKSGPNTIDFKLTH